MIARGLAVFSLAVALASAPDAATGKPASKPQEWLEVHSPHFIVVSNAGESQARRVAQQFELFRAVFQTVLPKVRVDPGQPIIILAVKNEKSLRELLPAYWETKGHMHPAGVFVPGPEKNYVALRVDAEGENPYQILYHEYVHQLIRLNFESIPVWLDEGLAEFYANSTLGGKEVYLGRPAESYLELLRSSRLLPLDVLLTADRTSPYYNEDNKASIFYAQSWALTHYFMIGDKGIYSKQLAEFLTLLQQEVDPREAALRAFGDLKQFAKKFESYIQRGSFYAGRANAPAGVEEKAFAARQLSAAESAAVRGDFHAYTGRPVEARALLDEAVRLDPNLAAPHETMGFLYFREGKREEAIEQFAQAVQLDSKSFLAHYFHATLSAQGILTPDRLALAETGLRKAIELNPNFAPAYSALAQMYAARGEKLDEALALAKKATALEPGALTHHLAVASVLLRMGKIEQAQKLGERVQAAAKTPADRAAAESFLQNVGTYQTQLAAKKRYDEQLRQEAEARKQLEEMRKRDAGLVRPATKEATAKGENPGSASQQHVPTAPGEGRVTALSCNGTALDLTLTYYGFSLRLHSENYLNIEYRNAPWQPPKKPDPCATLRNRNVRVEYRVATGKPYAGEVVSLEVLK